MRTDLKARAARRAKRKDNARFIAKVAGRKMLPSIKALKNRLWDLNTEAVKKRDGETCVACKTNPGYAQNHIVPQCEGPGIAYDLDNLFWGCSACNAAESFHRGYWQRVRFPAIFGPDKVAELWSRSRLPAQLRRGELNSMIDDRLSFLGIDSHKRIATK